jgi:hypothetical protein
MLTAYFSGIRKLALLSLSLGLCLAIAGCNDNPAPDTAAKVEQPAVRKVPTNRPVDSDVPPAAVVTPGAPASATVANAIPPQAMPHIPADAQWTIFCYAVKGPLHVQDANAMKDALVAKTGRADWYIIHGRDESNVYFGFYKAVQPGEKDTAEVTRAQNDLREIKELRDQIGNKPFEHKSAFISLESPDPSSPAEWNLFNVDRAMDPKHPKRGYWSLQIMAFRGNALRKEAAVQAVRELREKGVEAFYYHGESVSSVCIGHWPPDAVKAQNRTPDRPDIAHAESNLNIAVVNFNPGEDVKARSIDGKQTVTVAPKLEIMDPALNATMKQYPNHAVNYEWGRKLPDGKEILNPSFLVEIPRAKGNGLYDSDPAPTVTRRNGIGDPNGPSMTGQPARSINPNQNALPGGLR